MDQFLHRTELSEDERAVLDVYLSGLIQGLDAVNQIRTANGQDAIYCMVQGLDIQALENLIDNFLAERADMLNQPLNVCAVIAVMQRYPA